MSTATSVTSLSKLIELNSPAIVITDAPPSLVKEIQKILKLQSNGIVDEATKQAFIKFKQDRGLEYPLGLGVSTAKALLSFSGATAAINLNIPYFSQRDNENRPSGTCNVTSVAMCLAFYGIKPKRNEQLEDELFAEVENRGWDRHVHNHLCQLFGVYGVLSRFTTEASWDEVKRHLRSGNPVIISGQFTQSGHIIVLRGYDEKGFWVNDPWGEWFSTGYQNKSGEDLHYSYDLCYRLSYGGAQSTWAHFPENPAKKNSGSAPATNLPLPGVELIRKFESCFLDAYPDPLSGNLPITIGWGCTVKEDGNGWKMGDRITQERANNLLISQLSKDYLPSLRDSVPYWHQMNVNQQSALLSFAYNLGKHFMSTGNFDSIRKALKGKEWNEVPEILLKYCNPGTKVKLGLKRRRFAEGLVWQGVDVEEAYRTAMQIQS